MVTATDTPPRPKLVVATRLHLGNAASPPSNESLQDTIRQLVDFCRSSQSSSSSSSGSFMLRQAVIAVDATPKFPNYDLVDAVQKACDQVLLTTTSSASCEETTATSTANNVLDWLLVLPVTPWGMFVPALNALLVHAMSSSIQADYIVFVSAESCSSSYHVLSTLWHHMDPETTLVCGAVLSGHDYQAKEESTQDTTEHDHDDSHHSNNHDHVGVQRELTGRTTPWNTMALWNLSKLALTGFLLISDGVVDSQAYGVEEVVAIATLQTLLGPEQAMAKLIAVPGVTWDQEFGADEQRKRWHEQKMASKYTRAQRQLDRLKLKGWVYHY